MKFVLPIHFTTKKKKSLLGMNRYRNAYYHEQNKAKKMIEEIVHKQIKTKKQYKKIRIEYKIYLANRRTDYGNVRSVIEKFFLDALVSGGVIANDTIEYIASDSTIGDIDKENPRAVITIYKKV